MTEIITYVLKCENNKWYIGRTNNLEKRIQCHFDGKGSEWTRLHKPIDVVETIHGDIFDEDKYTLKYMSQYDIDNVRGACYSEVVLDKNDIISIQKRLRGVSDKCFICGDNHFVKDCKYKNNIEMKCNAITQKGERCSRVIFQGKYCPQHQQIYNTNINVNNTDTNIFQLIQNFLYR